MGNKNNSNKKYPISRPHYLVRKIVYSPKNETNLEPDITIRNMTRYILPRAYPLSKSHHENYLRRLNSKNITIQGLQILGGDEYNICLLYTSDAADE